MCIRDRLGLVTRTADTLCRFGGDEFLYLAEGLESPKEAEVLAERLIKVIAEPYNIAGFLIEQRASIGIVIWDSTCTSFSETIQNVDAALYEAKRNLRGHHVVFTPTMHQRAVSRFSLVQEPVSYTHLLQRSTEEVHGQVVGPQEVAQPVEDDDDLRERVQ